MLIVKRGQEIPKHIHPTALAINNPLKTGIDLFGRERAEITLKNHA